MNRMLVPYFDLKKQFSSLRDEIREALDRVCGNTSFILGEEVGEFEKEFAAYCEVKYCVALNSGTSALHLALLALGVRPGDEVITTPNTFIATAEAICYAGAKPAFVDIDPKTANLDPALVELAITERTKAILPVHLYGRPAEMDPILEIAGQHRLAVIEDACQAHGARYRGRRVGSIGHAAAFSFYPSKNLSAYGEGGALTTNDAGIAELARSLRNHGQRGPYTHERIGYNYRMEGFQGAVLRVKLKRLGQWNTRRKEIAALYRRALQGTKVEIPLDDPRDERVYHLFVVYVERRDQVRAALEARGVHTAIHYPCPVHLQPAFAALGFGPGSFPHAERACERALSMPFFPEMTDEQVRYAAEQLADVVGDMCIWQHER
jgi:dTDP-4-amino-4,6-dideoxygalactose transaminase